jgi:hypothetical protein
MCCTNHHGDCDFEFLHYLYLGCPWRMGLVDDDNRRSVELSCQHVF